MVIDSYWLIVTIDFYAAYAFFVLDKMCDQLSDAVLDAHLEQDCNAKVACGRCCILYLSLAVHLQQVVKVIWWEVALTCPLQNRSNICSQKTFRSYTVSTCFHMKFLLMFDRMLKLAIFVSFIMQKLLQKLEWFYCLVKSLQRELLIIRKSSVILLERLATMTLQKVTVTLKSNTYCECNDLLSAFVMYMYCVLYNNLTWVHPMSKTYWATH